MTAPNVPHVPLFVCPSCRNPNAVIERLENCVVVTLLKGFATNEHGEPVDCPVDDPTTTRTTDPETLHKVRYACECSVQFNRPIDLNEPVPLPEPPEDALRIDTLGRRDGGDHA